jgi:acyl dehydratase
VSDGRQDAWVVGEPRRPRNLSADAVGSIHDDATAGALGFRGGTVAGNVHMDVFPRLLVDEFGPAWFETGSLSLAFLRPTVDGEPVRAVVDRSSGAVATASDPSSGIVAAGSGRQHVVWLETVPDDGDPVRVAEGTAALGHPGATALEQRDLRPADPASLRMLADVAAGMVVPAATVHVSATAQPERVARGGCADPLDWYTGPSPWGGPVASPLTLVDLLYRHPSDAIAALVRGPFVGMFGAIEIRHVAGPVLLDATFTVKGTVVAVGDSPKTEVVWFDSVARDAAGRVVATMRMQSRLLKASSPLYG